MCLCARLVSLQFGFSFGVGTDLWQGRTTAGAFQLVVDDKVEKIEAHVEMVFSEHRSYEHTNVCLMDRQHSDPPAMGLGIYVSFLAAHAGLVANMIPDAIWPIIKRRRFI
jgi:hypothetical protein